MANATITSTEKVYLYESKNLIIVYSCVLVASIAAVFIGAFSLHSNGISYDTSVSTFAITMQNPEVCSLTPIRYRPTNNG
jgi:hypothetical protein